MRKVADKGNLKIRKRPQNCFEHAFASIKIIYFRSFQTIFLAGKLKYF
jgi:hypothetical protein